MELVQDFLEKTVDKSPDKVALIQDHLQLTYRDLEDRANSLSQKLMDLGFKPGERAVLHLENSPALVIGIFAVLKAGGVFVLAHPSTKMERLRYLLSDAEASVLIADGAYLSSRYRALSDLPRLMSVIAKGGGSSVDQLAQVSDMDFTLEAWDESAEAQANRPASRRIDLDLAALIYTSGSTGYPKGVMLSHRNMLCAAQSIITYLGIEQHDVILSALPMSFDYGLYQILMALRQGATVVLERSFAFPHSTLSLIPRHQVTAFPLVPTMSTILLDLGIESYDFSSLRLITNTGAALPVEHILRWRKLLPHVEIFAMYGLTECKRVSYLPPQDLDRKIGSVGIPIPNTEVFVVGPAGEILPPHSIGELVVRGGHVMQGYWRAPELTDKKLRSGLLPGERVLYTGDLFRRDEEGYLYFEGRQDDIIKSRGEKVSPLEIEEALYSQDDVAEAAVLGVSDPYYGEAVVAFVTPKQGLMLDKKSVLRQLKASLEDYKVPSQLHIMSVLPKTPNGKIDKNALKKSTGDIACKHVVGRC